MDKISIDIRGYVDERIRDIRDIIDTRYGELVHRMEYRAEVSQTALKEAKTELSARLAGMNEFRDTIKDLIASFATRAELDALKDQVKTHTTRAEHDALIARIEAINICVNGRVTHSDFQILKEKYDAIRTQQTAMLIAIIMTLLAVVWDLIVRM